jgi:hypothetical protein
MMENPQRLGTLRVLVITNLVLLALLLIFGLAFDPTNVTGKTASPFSATETFSTLERSGTASFIHMGLGILVGITSLANMVLCLQTGIKRLQISGSLAFLAILFAGTLGLFFIFSGLRNTTLLLGLVPLFILAVVSDFMELIFLRAPARMQAG